jgi:hypothetical protein
MAGIAISYRREDAAWITGRIFDRERKWSNWHVLSGVVHGRKFYFRRWYTDDGVVSMEFFYSPNLAGLFDKLIPKMTRELKFMTAAY